MKTFAILIFGALALGLYSCDDDDEVIDDEIVDQEVELNYNFEADDEGWEAGIGEVTADDISIYEFESDQMAAPFDDQEGVLMLSASNPDENLFLFASKEVSGLEPNTMYEVSYTVEFASSVAIDTTGFDVDTTGTGSDTIDVDVDTGGMFENINDTVIVKVGATDEEPVTQEEGFDFLQLIGIDIGEPGVDGADLVVIGSFTGSAPDEEVTLQTAATDTPLSVTTNDDGELWLIVGTESFGNRTEIYINSIDVAIKQ